MRSSRSKRLGLNLVADDDPRYSRSPENSLPKSYGGFSSFFGRSKRGKSPVQSIRIGSPDPTVDDHTVTLPDPQVVRTSLTLDRYRTMSHSMSDLSAVISRTDPAIAQFSVTAPLETLRSDLATDLSPTKRSSTKDNENLDFSDSSIAKHGWLNKKVTKKETNMKLHKVFVGQGDDFLHNSTDISRSVNLSFMHTNHPLIFLSGHSIWKSRVPLLLKRLQIPWLVIPKMSCIQTTLTRMFGMFYLISANQQW